MNAHRAIIEAYIEALPSAPSLETIKAELQTALAYSGYGPSSQWAAKHGSRLIADMAAYRQALEAVRDRHIPVQPMADYCDEATYVRMQHSSLRAMAAAALREHP